MPKVLSYTPPWLSRPEPAFQLFNPSQGTLSSTHKERRGSDYLSNGRATKPYLGPTKVIAHRGTEVFVAVDNRLRWADLCMLKDDYDDQEAVRKQKRQRRKQGQVHQEDSRVVEVDGKAPGFTELQVNIAEKIRQLSLSPNGNCLAVVTSHTVHVVLLPHSSKLGLEDNKPIKPLTRTVAPTAHVLAQSPVASVLWHPCGVDGNCLVTITADAVVRLWEIDFKDHMSFDTPSLAVDLKKLAVGASRNEDFRPNKSNANRSFSLDSVGMDVASACFGGNGSSEESPWCAMTLWIAMKEGDVYALCPLLPSKWQPSSTMIPSLSVQIVSTLAANQEVSLPQDEVQQSNDQYQWITDLDGQQPHSAHGDNELLPGTEVYRRPLSPSPIPKLQGPFQVFGDEYDQDPDISDIHVIAATVDVKELLDCEDSDTDSGLGMDDETGLAASIVCLLTRTGRIYVCLDLDGVQAQWLPARRDLSISAAHEPSLVIFEMVDTLKIEHVQETEWPTFSLDVESRYSFFVTHSQAVYYLSLEPWTQSLQRELQGSANVGTEFRIDIITNGPGTFRERVLDFQQDHQPTAQISTAAVIFQDSDLGYFLLTALDGVAQSVLLDKPDTADEEELIAQTTYDLPQARETSTLATGPARQPYVPPSSLWKRSTVPQFFSTHVQNRHKRALKEEIRLSSATLDLMTQAHRVLSEETHALGLAAADLFRRCHRLQDELKDQIERVKEASKRTEEVIGGRIGEASSEDTPNATVERRLKDARERQERLAARFEALCKKVRQNNCKQLSDKERAFLAESDKINRSVSEPDEKQENGEKQHSSELWHRYNEAKRLAAEMIAQAKETSKGLMGSNSGTDEIPAEVRRARVGQVMGLLERESALVDATQKRLGQLSLSTPS